MKKRFCLFALALVLSLLALNRVMLREDSKKKYGAFYSEKQPIDVFFLGTSHVMDAVYPTELFERAGIASYNLGNPAETLEATAWTLKLALQKQKPKVVVVDVCYIDKAQSDAVYSLEHLFLDAVPFSMTKWQAVRALFPEERRAEYLFPLAAYHTRWEEILFGGGEDTTDAEPFMKGAELRVGRAHPADFTRTAEMDLTETEGKRALKEIIELCRAEGIEVVLLAVPYPADEAKQRMMNSAQAIADAYDVPFSHLMDGSAGVDFETDCYDEASHLNPDGAVKVSAYLSERLTVDFDLPDRRQDAAYGAWNDAAAAYHQALETRWTEPYGLRAGETPKFDD